MSISILCEQDQSVDRYHLYIIYTRRLGLFDVLYTLDSTDGVKKELVCSFVSNRQHNQRIIFIAASMGLDILPRAAWSITFVPLQLMGEITGPNCKIIVCILTMSWAVETGH